MSRDFYGACGEYAGREEDDGSFCGRVKPDDVDLALETALLASGSNFKPNRTERHE